MFRFGTRTAHAVCLDAILSLVDAGQRAVLFKVLPKFNLPPKISMAGTPVACLLHYMSLAFIGVHAWHAIDYSTNPMV